jgi:hypothetical protein
VIYAAYLSAETGKRIELAKKRGEKPEPSYWRNSMSLWS